MKPKKRTRITPSDLRAEAARLIALGQMPDLSSLLSVIASVREIYRPKILEARRGKKQWPKELRIGEDE